MHRLRGELLLARSGDDVQSAETCFRSALEIAGRQEARSLQLRAAISLARHHRRLKAGNAALESLQTCYDGFTEGRDTADLREARGLLGLS